MGTMFLKRSAGFLSYFSDVTKGSTSLQFQGSGAIVVKINVHSLLSIHSLLPCLRLLAPETNFTLLNAPPMGINSLVDEELKNIKCTIATSI